jgi:hypothetical protein
MKTLAMKLSYHHSLASCAAFMFKKERASDDGGPLDK